MKQFVLLMTMAVLLTACGSETSNKLDLDLDKVQSNVADEVLGWKSIESGSYEEDDIELVKVCEAIERGKEDFGFNGTYLIYWQTTDKEFQGDFRMTSDYEIGYSIDRYKQIEDRCITFD